MSFSLLLHTQPGKLAASRFVSIQSLTIPLHSRLVLRLINRRYNFDWSFSLHHSFLKKIGKFRLILQVAFCHPPGLNHSQANLQQMPVRFHFAETNSAAPTGEYAIGYMLASLFTAIENYYGSIPTRLYRAFRPKVNNFKFYKFNFFLNPLI